MTRLTQAVTDFIENVDHPLKHEVDILRAIILAADAGITEQIKWKAPSFCYQGQDRITFNLHKNDRVLIVFHRGAKAKDSQGFRFEDRTGLLEWVSADRALLTFHDKADIQEKQAALTSIVSRWIHATTE
jgi:hypothetical protein